MRKLLHLVVALMALTAYHAQAQSLASSDCPGAISVCQNVYVETVSPFDSGKQELTDINNDCLGTYENYTTWYIINVVADGSLAFTITPPSAVDYDFAVFNLTGDGTRCNPSSCDLIANNLPVRCNYSGSPVPTGLSNTLAGPFEKEIDVKAGETYVLVVDNFSGRSGSAVGYTIDFGASTASIFDKTSPKFKSIGTHCNYESSSLTITMSELIQCRSIAPDGSDFSVAGATGSVSVIAATSEYCKKGSQFTSTVDIQLSSVLPPGAYVLQAKVGTDGSPLIDNCGNSQDLSESLNFNISEDPNPFLIKSIEAPACRRTRVILSHEVLCKTIAANGSDFKLNGPDTTTKVIRAIPIGCKDRAVECSTVVVADTIDLEYNQSIQLPGMYTITVQTGTDTNALLDTCGGTVLRAYEYEVRDNLIDANATNTYLCEPGFVFLDVAIPLKPAPDGYGLTWKPSFYVGDTTAANTQAYVAKTSTYTVQLMDSAFCYQRDTVTVEVSTLQAGITTVLDTSICIGNMVHINATGGAWYTWWPAEGLSCTRCNNPVATPMESTRYFVKIADNHDCADTLSVNIGVDPLPATRILNKDTVIKYGQSVALMGAGARQYNWMPSGSLSAPNTSSVIATPTERTMYILGGVSSRGCRAFDTVTVDIDFRNNIFVPTAFSPNGDGKNDVFRVSNLTFQRIMEFRVFNRWGQEIFSTNDAQKGWDGTWKGQQQPIGNYRYIIIVGFPDGIVETYKGDITLIR